jgi:hypothetical protein
MDPANVPAEIERLICAARQNLRGSKRRIRVDTHIAEASVYSYPLDLREENSSRPEDWQEYERWRHDVVEWALADAGKRGLHVLSIVEHLDEPYPHLHVLAVPLNDRLDARETHPGYQAKRAALEDGASPKIANRRLREAMRSWQDDFYQKVSVRHGLSRLGPKRRRLSRAEYLAEQAQQVNLAAAHRSLDDREAAVNAAVEASNAAVVQIERRATELMARQQTLAQLHTQLLAAAAAERAFDRGEIVCVVSGRHLGTDAVKFADGVADERRTQIIHEMQADWSAAIERLSRLTQVAVSLPAYIAAVWRSQLKSKAERDDEVDYDDLQL